MNKSKQLKFSIIIVSLVLAVAALVTVILLLFYNKFDKIGEVETTPVDLNLYTDSKNFLNDSTKTIYNYVSPEEDYLFDSSEYRKIGRIRINYDKLELFGNEDDNIVQLIPKQLFCTVGETFHIGKEYGFVINTENHGTHYSSEVLVFSFNFIYTSSDNKIVVEVKPLVNKRYIYISSKLKKLNYEIAEQNFNCDTKELVSSKKVNYTINYNIPNDIVVFAPDKKTKGLDEGYLKTIWRLKSNTTRYIMRDIDVSLQLLNEQEFNKGDKKYSVETDNGYFFTYYNYFNPFYGRSNSVDVSYETNKEDQLNNYKDENNNPTLIKKVEITNKHYPHKFKDVLNPNSYQLCGEFYISDYCGIENIINNNYTRIIRTVEIGIYNLESKDLVATGTSQKNEFINEQNKEKLKLNEKQDVCLFSDGKNQFKFNVEFYSDYNIKLLNSNNLEVKIDDKIIEFNNDKVVLALTTGEHKIEINNKTNERIFSYIYIEPNVLQENESNKQITVLPNQKYILQINTFGVKNISTNSDNVLISETRGVIKSAKFKQAVKTIPYNFDYDFANEFTNNYIILENITNEKQTINFSISNVTNTLIVGEDNEVVFSYDYISYYKFIPEISGTYAFKVENVSVHNQHWGITKDHHGELVIGPSNAVGIDGIVSCLNAGETYYVYFINTKEEETKNVHLSVKKYNYKNEYSLQVSDSENTYITYERQIPLIRGKSYSFKVLNNGEPLENAEFTFSNNNTGDETSFTFVDNKFTFNINGGFSLGYGIEMAVSNYPVKFYLYSVVDPEQDVSKIKINDNNTFSFDSKKYIAGIEFELNSNSDKYIYMLNKGDALKNNVTHNTVNILDYINSVPTNLQVKITKIYYHLHRNWIGFVKKA